MLQSALVRAYSSSVHRSRVAFALARPGGHRFVRTNSTQPNKDALKRAVERQDDLQRDWDARILTYADVKPKTQSPKLVRDAVIMSSELTESVADRAHT
jgi:hypothetical protein